MVSKRKLGKIAWGAMSSFALVSAVVHAEIARTHFNIASQATEDALVAFASSAKIQLVFPPEIVAGLKSPALIGDFMPDDGLRRLLAGTDLEFHFVSDTMLVIRRRGEYGADAGAGDDGVIRLARAGDVQDADHGSGTEDISPRADTSTGELADSQEFSTITVFGRGQQKDSVRDVPRSVTVIGREALETIGNGPTATLTDAFRFLPSASNLIGDYSFGSNFSIRGASPPTYSWNGMIRLSYMSKVSLANVERLEALMGPASVTYGAMQPGGVINVITKQPTADFRSQLNLQAGSWDTYGGSVDLSGPISDRVRARLNASYDDLGAPFDHWRRKTIFVAPVVEFDLTDRTLLTVEAFHQNVDYPDGIYDGRIPAVGTLLRNPNGAQIPEGLNTAHFAGITHFRLKASDANVRLRHELSDAWALNAQAYYYEQRMDGLDGFLGSGLAADNTVSRDLYPRDEGEDSYGISIGLAGKFQTAGVAHQMNAGVDYLAYDYTWAFGSYTGPAPIAPLNVFDPDYSLDGPLTYGPSLFYQSSSRAAAAYVQERASFGEKFSLVAGARYTDSLDGASMFYHADGSTEVFPDVTAKKWSTQLGALYHFTDILTAYAGRNTSFVPRAPIQLRDGSIYTAPETAIQYELGLRAQLADSNAVANLTLFRTTRPNALTNDPVDPFFSVPNGELTSEGVEASLSGRILPGWTAFAAYAYNPTEVTKSNILGQQGLVLQNAPEHSASLITRYDAVAASLRGFGVSLALNYLGEKYADAANLLVLPTSLRVDLGLHYRVRDGLEIGLQGKNLTDEDIYNGFSPVMVVRNAGRNYMLNVKLSPAQLRR
jgi:iron complex outermembrane receptor protein